MTQQATPAIGGMHCDGCVRVVHFVLELVPGVTHCIGSLENGHAEVSHDLGRGW